MPSENTATDRAVAAPRAAPTTLARFLRERSAAPAGPPADLGDLVLDIARACRRVAAHVARGAAHDLHGPSGTTNVQGETQQRLDVLANDAFLHTVQRGGRVAGMVSEEMPRPYRMPPGCPRGRYLLAFDPIDGSSNIDANAAVGSVFSVLPAPRPGADPTDDDFLQPGHQQVAAGYAVYGPSTVLVLGVGGGVHGFTLDPDLGEFVLTHPEMRIAPTATEFAVNASNRRFWEPAVRRYVDECVAGASGPLGRDYNMRWTATMAADLHRILVRGGIYLYPGDARERTRNGRLRLLYETAPAALLVELAGGAASTGRRRVLDVVPGAIHDRCPIVFGASDDVARVERLYRRHATPGADAPLFGARGLYRAIG